MEKKLKAAAEKKKQEQAQAMAKKAAEAASANKTYRMSDANSSGETSEEESSDDEGSSKKPKKPPADWARSSPLKKALKMQFGLRGPAPINPDQIFAERTSCNLEKIFDMKKKRYQRRGSSGQWQVDRVTDEEKDRYARRMGFAPLMRK